MIASPIVESPEEIGSIGHIPVRNLWLLMLYASELFRHVNETKYSSVEDNPDDIPDLVAEVLSRQVERRLKRDLSFGYRSRDAVIRCVRGHINLLHTERHQLLDRGKVACHFDVLTVDTVRNRFVRSALEEIAKIVHCDTLAHRCRSLAVSLRRIGVTGERPSRSAVSFDRFGRHDAEDQQMVAAAHLAFNLALPTESAGTRPFAPPYRGKAWIWKLYEKGIAGFYDVVLPTQGWRINPGKILRWPTDSRSPGIDKILPSMRTDIVLDHAASGRRIVIDLKFNSVLVSGWYRKETLQSKHLYQMYAYLRSQEENGDPLAANASGLLLHPAVDNMVDEWIRMQGHTIRFATIDLGSDTQGIRAQLLQVLEPIMHANRT